MQGEDILQGQLAEAIRNNDLGAFLQLSKAANATSPSAALENKGTWLMLCAKYNRVYFVKHFAGQATCKNAAGETALMVAAMHGSLQVARLLRESEMNLTDENGWTALMHSAARCDVQMVKLLQNEQGMQSKRPVAQFPAGSCALFIAAMQNSFPLVQMLAKEINLLDKQQIDAILQSTNNRRIDQFLKQTRTLETAESNQGVFVFEKNGFRFSSLTDELQSTLLPTSPTYMRAQSDSDPGGRDTAGSFSGPVQKGVLASKSADSAARAISDKKMLTLTLEIDSQDGDSARAVSQDILNSETAQQPQNSGAGAQRTQIYEQPRAQQAQPQNENDGRQREERAARTIALLQKAAIQKPLRSEAFNPQRQPGFTLEDEQETLRQVVSPLRQVKQRLQQHDKGTQTSGIERRAGLGASAAFVLALSICILGCACFSVYYIADMFESGK